MGSSKHRVPRSLALFICEHFTIPLTNCDKELIDRHGRVDCHLTAKEGLYVMFLQSQQDYQQLTM